MPRVVLPILPRVVDVTLAGAASALTAAGDVTLEFPADEAIVTTASGARLVPSHLGWEGVDAADAVVLAGPARAGDGPAALLPPALARALRTRPAAGSGRLVAAADAGVVMLADAGLLDGRRIVAARALRDQLAPRVGEVVVGPRVLRDGRVITAVGAAAGLELGLAVAQALLGEDAAARAADALEVRGWAPLRSGGADAP